MNRLLRISRKRLVIWGTVIFFGGLFLFLYYYTNPSENNHPDLSDGAYFIAHATGSLDGYTYLNSKESLINALDNGYQYIEVDLGYTSDSAVVCVHEWKRFNKSTIEDISENDTDRYSRVPSLEEFRQRKIYGRYTPMTLEDVIQIQKERPFTMVIDKFDIVETLNRHFDQNRRRRIMVETYSKTEFKELEAAGYIPMLSADCISYLNCIPFICSHLFFGRDYWVIVERTSSLRCLRLLKKMFGLKYAMYTMNSPYFFKRFLGSDIDLVYTDNWDLQRQINTFQDNSTY